MSSLQKISIVIPCYNPSAGWSGALRNRISLLKQQLWKYDLEVIVSNDGSPRLDWQEVEQLLLEPGVKFLNHTENQGKGATIRKGSAATTGDVVIYTDTDFPFGTEPIVEMVDLMDRYPRCEFIYGARSRQYFKQLPFKRRIISGCLKTMNVVLLSRKIKDTQAGIKAFRRSALQEMLSTKTNSFVFEIELIRKLIRRKAEIRYVTVNPEPGIVFSNFNTKVLAREMISLVRIFTPVQKLRRKSVITPLHEPLLELSTLESASS